MTCRIEEILESAKKTMSDSQVPDFLVNNIVLTGGVCTTVGIDKVTEEIFEKNVRIGNPTNIKNIPEELDFPTYSCALGMLIFSKNLLLREKIKGGFEVKGGWFKALINKIASV